MKVFNSKVIFGHEVRSLVVEAVVGMTDHYRVVPAIYGRDGRSWQFTSNEDIVLEATISGGRCVGVKIHRMVGERKLPHPEWMELMTVLSLNGEDLGYLKWLRGENNHQPHMGHGVKVLSLKEKKEVVKASFSRKFNLLVGEYLTDLANVIKEHYSKE